MVKLSQAMIHGAKVLQIRGNFDEALNLFLSLQKNTKVYTCLTRSIRFELKDKSPRL